MIFSWGICFAQDTLYFDAEWKPASKANFEYYQINAKNGDKWSRTDYFKSNKIQMRGTYSSLHPETEEGYFEWFHPNGKLRHKGNYTNGLAIDEHLWYHDNGNLEAKEHYKNGKLDGNYEEFHPNGALMNQSNFLEGVPNGWSIYYRDDGSKLMEGNIIQGNRNGEWKFYDETGKVESTNIFRIDYDIPEAGMSIKLPNDNWSLANHTNKILVQYTFKRAEIKDSNGEPIIPAIMIYVEDASSFKQDIVSYSIQKRLQFNKVNLKITNKILIPTNEEFPFSAFPNAMMMTATYSQAGKEHIFYMIYIINNENKGIQIYMDMTKDIAEQYEQEFINVLKSIKEIR